MINLWYHFTTYFWSNCRINILSLNVTSFIVFMPLRKEPFLYYAHVSYSVSMGYFRWYWSISFKNRVNMPSFSSSVLYSSNIVFVKYVDSCVVSWFLLLGHHDSAYAAILFSPGVYSICRPYSSNISFHRNTRSVLNFLHVIFLRSVFFWPNKSWNFISRFPLY